MVPVLYICYGAGHGGEKGRKEGPTHPFAGWGGRAAEGVSLVLFLMGEERWRWHCASFCQGGKTKDSGGAAACPFANCKVGGGRTMPTDSLVRLPGGK